MYEFDLNSFKLINATRLKREADTCIETTEAFKELIDAQPGYKEYWKVVICPRNMSEPPILEVAAFLDKKIAENYLNNIIKKHKDWDESILHGQLLLYMLPPITDWEELVERKIRFLKELSKANGIKNGSLSEQPSN